MVTFIFACLVSAVPLVQSVKVRLHQPVLAQKPKTAAQEVKSLSERAAAQAHWDPKLQAEALSDMEAFLAAAPTGEASLVVMGDSTMSGMLDDMMNLYGGMQGSARMVHVTNDRPQGVMFHKGMPLIKTGEQWADPEFAEDPLVQAVVKRAEAAVETLHSQNCTWAGGIETLVVFDGALKGLIVHHWGFIPEYGERCWDSCYKDAMEALKPRAIVWNIGLHLLNHDFDHATCSVRHNPSKKNCGNYEQMVSVGMSELAQVVPNVIFRTTNMLCEELQAQAFPLVGEKMRKWQDPGQRDALDKECQEQCPWYRGLTCSDWLMDGHTTARLYNDAVAGVSNAKNALSPELNGRLGILDAFDITRKCCDTGCSTGTVDGEHYRGLDKLLVHSLAAKLAHKID